MPLSLPNYKDIIDLIKKGATLEAQQKIMQLREAAIDLQEENLVLKQRVKELEDSLAFKGRLAFRPPYYYAEGDDVPFCPTCWEADHIPMHLTGHRTEEGTDYACAKC